MHSTNNNQTVIKFDISKYSNFVKDQILAGGRYINDLILNEKLKAVLLDTRNGYRPLIKELMRHSFCLHAMRKGSPLDGCENYFTIDIKEYKNTFSRGPFRLLGKFNGKKSPQCKFIGIVDTHQGYYKSNLIDWNDLRNTNDYIQVPVTRFCKFAKKCTVNYIAVKKMKTMH